MILLQENITTLVNIDSMNKDARVNFTYCLFWNFYQLCTHFFLCYTILLHAVRSTTQTSLGSSSFVLRSTGYTSFLFLSIRSIEHQELYNRIPERFARYKLKSKFEVPLIEIETYKDKSLISSIFLMIMIVCSRSDNFQLSLFHRRFFKN